MRAFICIAVQLLFYTFCNAQTSVVINKDKLSNEPSIAVHRTDPSIIVAASNLNTIYYSADTGQSWNSYLLESVHGFYGDPVLHATHDGSIYLTHLSKTKGKAWGDWFDRIVVQRSDDGGRSFTEGVGVGFNGDKTQDKPWLASDEFSEAFKGSIYLTWTEFDKYGSTDPRHRSRIRFSYSRDHGETWSSAVTISDGTGDCIDSDNTLEGATIAVDEKGVIYCVWAGHDSIYMDQSSDGGLTWNRDRVIGLQPGGWSRELKGLGRANGMPFVVSDAHSPFDSSTLWVTWVSDQNETGKVVVIRSRDYGKTWTLLRSPDYSDGVQIFSNIAAEPEHQNLYVLYNESDRMGNGYFMQTVLGVWSGHDTGMLNIHYVEPAFALPGPDKFFGDYLDIDVAHGRAHMIYTTTNLDGDLQVKYSVIPIIKTTVPEERLFSVSPHGNVAVSFQNSALYLCIDHVKSCKIKVVNKKWSVFPRKRGIFSYEFYSMGSKSETAPVREYRSFKTPHKHTKVKVSYVCFEQADHRCRKVKRKTKFKRMQDAADIN